MASIHTLRLVGITGTNKVMAGELSRLVGRALRGHRLASPRKVGQGILLYPFVPEVAQVAVHYHRTASRVLWDLYESRAKRLEPLYDEIAADVARDSRDWSRNGMSFSIRARNVGAFAAGERQVVGAVKNALIDGAARRGIRLRVEPDAPDLHVAVRMNDDLVTVSLDLVGGPMHERGYRRQTGDAPLRENLAAALVMLTRHDARRECLVDPMTGSGTIAIEAALMARGVPLWQPRKALAYRNVPALEGLPNRDEPLFGDTRPRIFASDIDSRAVAMAQDNARAAGVDGDIVFHHGEVSQVSRRVVETKLGVDNTREGVILVNPPYGERLPAEAELYARLGGFCSGFGGFRAGFLVANPDFVESFGGRPRVTKPLANGNQRATFYLYDG